MLPAAKARRHLVNCQVNQAVPNPQRDIAAGEHYEIYIGAAHEHDGKTDELEQRRQLGQIAKNDCRSF